MFGDMFGKYKHGCKYFIETGTYEGDGIIAAQKFNFEKYFSIEYNFNFYQKCYKKFKSDKSVKIYFGSSDERLKEIMLNKNERCLFWLDAHDTFGTGGGVPTYKELEIIKNHPIKNHTIIIDDVPLYFGDGVDLYFKLLEINPNYIIERINPHGENNNDPDMIDRDIVAYIKE